MRNRASLCALALIVAAVGSTPTAADTTASAPSISMLVMDPLALPLSCPCVEGYAQRDYEVLGKYLSEQLGRPVVVTFAESIRAALEKESVDEVHLVIGKDSVVRSQGKQHKMDVSLLARLVGKDGKTTQTGLVVVPAASPAQTVSDLEGFRIIFGPPECDEKFSAARALIEAAGVELASPKEAEISQACSDGACAIIEWGEKVRGAAVISSYAAPLLEGCGTIKKGDLRVVGETKPVPFVAAFATKLLTKEEQLAVQKALYEARKAPGMLTALETMLGFVPKDFKPVAIPPAVKSARQAPNEEASTSDDQAEATTDRDAAKTTGVWPGWLGPQRNGRVNWLPHEFSRELKAVWRRALGRPGMGGIAATDQRVYVGDRDIANRADVFRCLDANTGDELWTVTYPTIGQLDYDNAPRATPLLHDVHVYFFGAFGDLTCADADTGEIMWRVNIRLKFLALAEAPWGTCSSPLIVDDMIIVNPGAPTASLAALDAATGEVRWTTPGEGQGYGSFIVATLGGVRQIVGHTQTKLCGWDPTTGSQLWSLQPQDPGDFNVPTPVVVGERLLVATENNGGRLYAFADDGKILPEPEAVATALDPQMSTPIVVGNRVFCVNGHLDCFDAAQGLKKLWRAQDRAFADFGALLASEDRLLAQGRGGELLLLDALADSPRIVARAHVAATESDRGAELFTFPALVGNRLYVRCEREVVCVEL